MTTDPNLALCDRPGSEKCRPFPAETHQARFTDGFSDLDVWSATSALPATTGGRKPQHAQARAADASFGQSRTHAPKCLYASTASRRLAYGLAQISKETFHRSDSSTSSNATSICFRRTLSLRGADYVNQGRARSINQIAAQASPASQATVAIPSNTSHSQAVHLRSGFLPVA